MVFVNGKHPSPTMGCMTFPALASSSRQSAVLCFPALGSGCTILSKVLIGSLSYITHCDWAVIVQLFDNLSQKKVGHSDNLNNKIQNFTSHGDTPSYQAVLLVPIPCFNVKALHLEPLVSDHLS